jgi:uncharacterized protein
MEDHPNAAIYRQADESMKQGGFDPVAYFGAVADDVEWWEIGRKEPIIGKEALMARMQEQMGDWEIKPQLHDVIANDEHMVALVNVEATRGGQILNYRTAEIYHVRDGKITHRWAFSDDTEAINKFFA